MGKIFSYKAWEQSIHYHVQAAMETSSANAQIMGKTRADETSPTGSMRITSCNQSAFAFSKVHVRSVAFSFF